MHILLLLKNNYNVLYTWKMYFKLILIKPLSFQNLMFFKFILSYTIGIPKLKGIIKKNRNNKIR
jgi:hypothetical protein